MKDTRKFGMQAAFFVAAAALATMVAAQDFRSSRSTGQREGVPSLSPSTVPGTLPAFYNNVGRGFLRWWHPLQEVRTFLDNDDTVVGTPSGVSSVSAGAWTSPDPIPAGIGATTLAYLFDSKPGITPYRMTRSTAQTINTTDPTAGATAIYEWQFNNLTAGQEYQLFVNIPIGPTAVSFPYQANDYPQRYYVYQITGITDGPDNEVVDVLSAGGGLVRLGEDGTSQNVVYVPTGNTITIRLYNTAPRGGDGALLDPLANPGAEWVYADSAYITSSAVMEGGITAQPVAAELSATPPASASVLNANFNRRVYSARNEIFVSGTLADQLPITSLSSFFYDGDAYDGNPGFPLNTTENERLNTAFNWPVRRPFNSSTAEQTRYNNERETWVNGPVAGNERHTFRSVQDNRGALTTPAGTFVADNTIGAFQGPDYHMATSVGGAPTGAVSYLSNLPNGDYFVQVWMPTADAAGTLTRSARYNIYQGATLVDTVTLDQSAGNGWVALPGQPDDGYTNDRVLGRLRVELINQGDGADAGRVVYADAVRYVNRADLSISSTPIFATTSINAGGTNVRDVIIASTEDGRIYCMDAHGDRATGAPPQVYWTFPSDNPATDPNAAAGEDYGVAELPTGFNTSSGLVANVGGDDLLYIASENGRVYCLEVEGRGDGTTRRRWTWPDDFNPTAPAGPRQAPLEPLTGSVSFSPTTGPNGAILVPTVEGRLYAIDALGAATKTTSMIWQYPDPGLGEAPLGTMDHAPMVAFGSIVFGAEDAQGSGVGEVFSLNPVDGRPFWRSSGFTTAFGRFGSAGPAAIDGTWIITGPNSGDDMIIVADLNGRVASIDPAGAGALHWDTTELVSGASAGPVFTYMSVFNNTGGGNISANVPCVVIPANGGGLVGLMIDGTTNIAGTRRVWQYDVQGSPTPIAVGGWAPADFRSWLYVGDSDGIMYAFNGNDDLTPGILTPGEQPGTEVAVENDESAQLLDDALIPDNLILLSPEGFEIAQALVNAGTFTSADAANLAANHQVTRRTFEIGETLHIMAHSMADIPSVGAYVAEVRIAYPGGTQARQVQVRDYQAPSTDNVMLAAIPILSSGRSAVKPGQARVSVRLIPTARRNLATTDDYLSPVASQGYITIANPLALLFNRVGLNIGAGVNSVGDSPDATLPNNIVNGSPGVDAVPGTVNGPVKESLTPVVKPGAYFGPDADTAGDGVTHGGSGAMNIAVRDRSLSYLIYGPGRGLQNVKMGGEDIVWQIRTLAGVNHPVQNRYKPLSQNGVAYPGFEDAPTLEPNRSLDYPDISRNSLSASKSAFGRVENPFFTGVALNPPQVTPAAEASYRTAAGFDAQMARNLTNTVFDVRIAVPRFQPASGPENFTINNRPGYRGVGFIFADASAAGLNVDQDSYRDFALAVRVAPDERLSMATPTVDLASMPGGAGYNGGAVIPGPFGGRAPMDPNNAASAFRPWRGEDPNLVPGPNNEFFQQFESFGVLNEGNVNMLNVRVAKAFDETTTGANRVFRPLELFAPGLHELAWLDGALHMHTSLDPLYSNTGPGTGGANARANIDVEGRMILQKARPGDLVPTRLSVNPSRRPNANLGATGGNLLDPVLFRAGDPKIGVSAPIGTPVGEYIRDIFVFEDSIGTNATAAVPSLGPKPSLFGGLLNNSVQEPYSEPPLTLKFAVRETRLTNRPTAKSSPNVDNMVLGSEDFFWANRQPTAFRNQRGDMFVAWVSDRLSTVPDFRTGLAIPNKTAANTFDQSQSRIYLSVLNGAAPGPINGANGTMMLRDLNLFAPAGNHWFNNRMAIPGDGIAASAIFDLNGPNNTDDFGTAIAGTERYFSPAFSTSGNFNNVDRTQGGRASTDNVLMAFLGEVDTQKTSGDRRTVNQLFMAQFTIPANLNTLNNPAAILPMPYDVQTKKTTPALVQTSRGAVNNAVMIYGSSSGSNAQLNAVSWRQGAGQPWSAPQALPGGNAFDRIGNPSAQIRRYQDLAVEGRLDFSFTARRRGRSTSEAFMGRMAVEQADANDLGLPLGNNATRAMRAYGPRVDALSFDTAAGVFWAPGAAWRLSNPDLNGTAAQRIDVLQLQGGVYTSILDYGSRNFDSDTRMMTFNTRNTGSTVTGGSVTIDTVTGSVKLTGTTMPRGTRLYIQYSPYYLATSQSGNVNYRSASMVWDDRLIGVYTDAANPSRNLVADLRYWRTAAGATPAPNASIRNDRFVIAYTRTSGDGGRPTRPALRTMRFGVQLPTPIATNAAGNPVGLTVNYVAGIAAADQVAAGERFYQVDAANGRIYFTAGAEDKLVNINYQGVDGSGGTLPATGNVRYAVDLVQETNEADLPIEQGVNESDLYIALDPQNFDNPSRRPGLLWLFWSSTRSGSDDVYYQTIAPRFFPRPPLP